MKKILSMILFLSVLIYACTTPSVEGVHIRVKNASSVDYESVYINTSGGEHDYGPVEDGTISDYFEFERAYSYAQVIVNIDGETFVLQPIDYVGETPLDDGQYRYDIGVENFDNKILSIELKEE
jgi:hypothetical protein